jgi:hypothetical protein
MAHKFHNKFPYFDSFKVLYVVLIMPKLEYASVTWNNLTFAASNKLENI